MKANLLCGKETIRLELPDATLLIENKPAVALVNPEAAVLDALLHPIGTPPLKEIARSLSTLRPTQRVNPHRCSLLCS